MDFKHKHTIPNPYKNASLLSKLLFLWLVPLFRTGLGKNLKIDDLYDALPEDNSHILGVHLGNEWDKQRKQAKENSEQPSFFKALVSVFGKQYVFLSIAVLFDECVIRVAQPIFLRLLIRSFSDQSISDSDQYFYAFGVCFTSLLHAVIIHPLSFKILHIGMKCRISACALIYRKTLCLSKQSQENTTIGQLINLLSNDVNRFDMNLLFIPYLFVAPIQTIIFIYFLWEELGISCLAGISFIFFLTPVQYYIGMLSRSLRFKIAQKSDSRSKIMNEIVIGIRIIKMYAWEKPFQALIHQIRKEEVSVLKQRAYLRSFYLSLFLSSKKFIPYLTFLAYVSIGHTLTSDKVFFAVTIFDTIIGNMVSTLPSAAAGVGELTVSIKRIQEFLLLEEKKVDKKLEIRHSYEENEEKVAFVRMNNLSASWTGDKLHLNQLTFDLKGNKLVMVVGSVGSGKSSLLQALLGELQISSGQCSIHGKIAYTVQDPWIFQGTIRQNICYGKEYDEALYEDIVSVCALDSDFLQLAQGDSTYVGERGVALSGGQKARVNLARGLYQTADIYLLDDPLSAVDSRVSRHIFQKCIKQYLNGSLRILVTHQLQYLPQADHVIVMNKNQIIAQGTYQALEEQGIDFLELITSEVEPDLYRKASLTKLEAIEQELKKEGEILESQEEKMAAGAVSWKTYYAYFRGGNSRIGMFFVFMGFLVSQILYTASDYWLSHWTNAEEAWAMETRNFSDYTQQPVIFNNGDFIVSNNETTVEGLMENIEDNISSYLGQYFYISVYSGLVLLIGVATNIHSPYFFRYCMKISINIHNSMFKGIVRAPMTFFGKSPSGRIMNRFTKDLCSIDESLPAACFDVITIFLITLGVIVVVILSNYYVFIPSTCLIISLYLIRRFYIQTSRDVKRIEAVSRSPLFTHLTSSIQGLITIRALNAQEILIKQFDGHQDIHSAAWFLFISSNRWFGIWLELISITYLVFVTFSFMILSTSTKSGFVGLAISSLLSLTFKFQWGMRQSAEMENLMTSVERCIEYTKLEPEVLESKDHPKNWPNEGAITFRNVSLSYDESNKENNKVLKNLNFEIKGNEKIGIIGRTGAGKSSIIAALFRMTEPQGDILIDGISTKSLGLHDLRKSISIIPQDPVLFSGTVRYNLDPFNQFKDDELWRVIEEVELKDAVPSLDFMVADSGSNFSVGQRQLICLSRALLRQNKIIVMDEATANVDPKTDALIQKTIRLKFSECTILTIAHRLHSVIDNDKIIVLDNGNLMEFDHPHILLKNKESILFGMAQHTGKHSLAFLKNMAANAFNNRTITVPEDNTEMNYTL